MVCVICRLHGRANIVAPIGRPTPTLTTAHQNQNQTQVLRASEETDYMYASIDLVSHRLTRLLRKYKDRKLGKRKVR
jgi:ribosomal subunit interface protein